MSAAWPYLAHPSVFLFEPHPLTVTCLQSVLQTIGPIEVLNHSTGLALTPMDASNAVFIMDRAAQFPSASEGIGRLRARLPNAKAILLDFACDPDDQFHALSIGFKGVVLYEHVEKKLHAAILSVVNGGYWVEDAILAQYVHGRPSRKGSHEVLTDREAEIAELLKRKLSNKEISAFLALSEGTVKFHIANIFSKLRVRDRWSAVELLNERKGANRFVPVSERSPSLRSNTRVS